MVLTLHYRHQLSVETYCVFNKIKPNTIRLSYFIGKTPGHYCLTWKQPNDFNKETVTIVSVLRNHIKRADSIMNTKKYIWIRNLVCQKTYTTMFRKQKMPFCLCVFWFLRLFCNIRLYSITLCYVCYFHKKQETYTSSITQRDPLPYRYFTLKFLPFGWFLFIKKQASIKHVTDSIL